MSLQEALVNLQAAEEALRASQLYKNVEKAREELRRLHAEAATQYDPTRYLKGDYPVVRVEISRYHDHGLVFYVPLKEGYWVLEGEETYWLLLSCENGKWVASKGDDPQEATDEEKVALVAYSTATWVDPLLRRLPDYVGEEFYIVGF